MGGRRGESKCHATSHSDEKWAAMEWGTEPSSALGIPQPQLEPSEASLGPQSPHLRPLLAATWIHFST